MPVELLKQLPEFLFEHISDQVIGFRRGKLIFLFNFNPVKSFFDYGVQLEPGKYELVLDSDSLDMGGHGRVMGDEPYFTGTHYIGDEETHWFQVYLPTRTALVFEKVD